MPKLVRLGGGHGNRGDGDVGAALAVEGEHLAHVHLVDVVGAEDADVAAAARSSSTSRFWNTASALPRNHSRADVHRRRHGRDVVAHLRRELPAAREVLHERAGLVLRQDR